MHLDARLTALHALGGFFVLRTGAPPHGPLPSLAQAYGIESVDGGDGGDGGDEGDGGDGGDGAQDPSGDDAQAPGGDDAQALGDDDAQAPGGTVPASAASDPLTVRVGRVAEGVRACEPRVAASIAQQGLAARLWSAALGCAVLYGRVPDLDARLLRWDPAGSAPGELWLTEVRALPADPGTIADLVLRGHVEPLAAALHARHRLAPALARGNAASALAGTARQLVRWARENGRPRVAAHARELTLRLLADPALAGTGAFGGAGFRRRSCCLYYRVPGGGVCGDCCFTRAPRSSLGAVSE
ncbi:(2Fe-2S)-binding protein [Streptomyces sp. NPDC046985]|uniref:(2Fe-2S)-binding protein n=1 Tax=Streptomyces sp. NPDC046985 TaxID=3155377 RepID=UPI0033DB74EE